MEPGQLAKCIDHTLLGASATRSDILRLCEEALQFGFAAVCVNPCWVPLAAETLTGSGIGIATVVGFPLGASRTAVKAAEASDAIAAGATEIDMVLNIGAFKSGDRQTALQDIQAVVEACAGRDQGRFADDSFPVDFVSRVSPVDDLPATGQQLNGYRRSILDPDMIGPEPAVQRRV